MEPMFNYTGPNPSDDAYVQALEKQCQDWEKLYLEIKTECDKLKQQLAIAQGNATAMTEKAEAAQHQLRHV